MLGIFKKKNNNEIIVYAPVSGKIKALKHVKDEVFSKEMIGSGIAIVPSEEHAYSPVEGKIKVSFPTGHAFGIETKNGPEILVHIGVDTVELNGKGFTKYVEQGKKVLTSTKLCDFDLKIINQKAKSSDIIIVATNESMSDWKIIKSVKDEDSIKRGEEIFKIVKK